MSRCPCFGCRRRVPSCLRWGWHGYQSARTPGANPWVPDGCGSPRWWLAGYALSRPRRALGEFRAGFREARTLPVMTVAPPGFWRLGQRYGRRRGAR